MARAATADQAYLLEVVDRGGLPPEQSEQSQPIKTALIGLSDRKTLLRIIDSLEEQWRVDWITWIDKTIVKTMEADPQIVARWLNHEIALRRPSAAAILQAVVRSYTHASPNDPSLWDALGRYHYSIMELEAGDECQMKARAADPNFNPIWCLQQKLTALKNLGRVEDARHLIADLVQDPRKDRMCLFLALSFFGDVGDSRSVIETVDALGGPSNISEAYPLYLYFSALEAEGELERCMSECNAVLPSSAGCFSSFHIFRNVAHKLDRYDEVQHIFNAPMDDNSFHSEAIEIAALAALDRDNYDGAVQLFERMTDKNSEVATRLNLTIAITIPGSKNIKSAYEKYRKLNVEHSGPEIQYVSHLFNAASSESDLLKSLIILKSAEALGQNNIWFQRLYIQVLVALNRMEEARSVYDALPSHMQDAEPLREQKIYFNGQTLGDADWANLWTQQIDAHYFKAVHAKTEDPEPIIVRPDVFDADILAFSCVFNAIEFLPWFLKQYRRLGVTHFVIVDNGSVDGSREYLSNQEDVSLFSHKGSFKEGAHGVRWINDLMQRYAIGKWAFFVDMDEQFVFPGQQDRRSLRDLLAYADRRGYQSFPSFMLDMFASRNSSSPGDFQEHQYFENSYFSFPSMRPPYRTVQGGLRARLTKRHILITKSPLVKVTADFRYLENNHTHTHLRPADITSALLHYKFVGNAAARIDEAISRQEHFMGGRFYKDLQRNLKGQSIGFSFRTRKYRGPKQLEKLGIIGSSHAW